MKKSIILTSFLLISNFNYLFAQNTDITKIYTGVKQSFNFFYPKLISKRSVPRVVISNVKNRYSNGSDRLKDNWTYGIQKTDIHLDANQVNTIVKDVLKVKLDALNLNKETLRLDFKFNTSDGTLADTEYTIAKQSLITFADIEVIDDQLRKNLKVTFTGIAYLHYYAVSYWFTPPVVF